MKRKALRVRSEGSIHPYVTEAESRKQHSDSPLCNSLYNRSVRSYPLATSEGIDVCTIYNNVSTMDWLLALGCWLLAIGTI